MAYPKYDDDEQYISGGDAAKTLFGGAASGAIGGAALGTTVFPGIGTAGGALIGGVAGLAAGAGDLFTQRAAAKDAAEQQRRLDNQLAKQNADFDMYLADAALGEGQETQIAGQRAQEAAARGGLDQGQAYRLEQQGLNEASRRSADKQQAGMMAAVNSSVARRNQTLNEFQSAQTLANNAMDTGPSYVQGLGAIAGSAAQIAALQSANPKAGQRVNPSQGATVSDRNSKFAPPDLEGILTPAAGDIGVQAGGVAPGSVAPSPLGDAQNGGQEAAQALFSSSGYGSVGTGMGGLQGNTGRVPQSQDQAQFVGSDEDIMRMALATDPPPAQDPDVDQPLSDNMIAAAGWISDEDIDSAFSEQEGQSEQAPDDRESVQGNTAESLQEKDAKDEVKRLIDQGLISPDAAYTSHDYERAAVLERLRAEKPDSSYVWVEEKGATETSLRDATAIIDNRLGLKDKRSADAMVFSAETRLMSEAPWTHRMLTGGEIGVMRESKTGLPVQVDGKYVIIVKDPSKISMLQADSRIANGFLYISADKVK
jgi:hypothetical protein